MTPPMTISCQEPITRFKPLSKGIEKGYGLLPYNYVLQGLAEDWWIMLKNEWIDTGEFRLAE